MSQTHLTKDIVLQLEQYSDSFDVYKKLLLFAEEVSVDRLLYRLDSLAIIFKFKNEALSLSTFEKFEDVEKYIFENRDEFLLASSQKITSEQFAKFDKKKLAKYLNLQIPDLTGSKRDKVVKLLTTSSNINNSFSNIINILANWNSQERYFKMFDIDIEQLKTFNDLLKFLQNSGHYQSCFHFIKKLKPELSKNLTTADKNKILENIKIETDISKYDPLFEQSHNYTSLDLFISDFNDYFKILEHKSFMEKIKKIGVPIVLEEKVPNSNAPKMLIIEVQNFDQIGKLGCSSWCLTRSKEQWNNYVGSPNRKFFIVHGFQKKTPNHILGVTYDTSTKSTSYCQNYDNKPSPLPSEYLNVIKQYCDGKMTINRPSTRKPSETDIQEVDKYIEEILGRRIKDAYQYKDYIQYDDGIKRYMIDSAERFFGSGISDSSGSFLADDREVKITKNYVDQYQYQMSEEERQKQLDNVLSELKSLKGEDKKENKKEEDVKIKAEFDKADKSWKLNIMDIFRNGL